MRTSKIFDVMKSNPGTQQSALKVMEQSYDAGAVAILAEFALVKLWEIEDSNTLEFTDNCKEAQKELNERYNSIMQQYKDEKLREKLLRYDDQASLWAAYYGESHFIQGYIEGYKMAKRAMGGDHLGK
ncbi:hypothetical protein EVU96_25010 [Bacillus infantis]|uniref:hypothetical protein n=1 Tax=Bacillus infantis TaxID=324767 RepID=UPI00101B9EF7|nr:hypothetical protein [Bacillus infantis]RYI25076.1 hypothetical protein EVU96_25010 [Bacillus infantis]